MASMHCCVDVSQIQKSVRDVGRQSGDGSIERVAGAGIVVGLHPIQTQLCRLRGGFKAGHGRVK